MIHLLADQVQRQARIHQICRVDRRVQRHLATPVHSHRTFLPLHQVDLLPSFPVRPRTVVQVRRLRTSHQVAQSVFHSIYPSEAPSEARVRSLQVCQRILQAGRRRRGHLEIQARSRPVSRPCFHPLTRPRYLLGVPTSGPTGKPSEFPSLSPSESPSSVPSAFPSTVPTQSPSLVPSSDPTGNPSSLPSFEPSGTPSDSPSGQPSSTPSTNPSNMPSRSPSATPSSIPSAFPSDFPSVAPSRSPSEFPSEARTVVQVRRLRTSHQLAQAYFTPYTRVRHHRKHRVRSLQVYQRILQAGRRRRGHLEIQARSRPVSLLCFHPLTRPRYLLGSQQADPRVNRVSFQV